MKWKRFIGIVLCVCMVAGLFYPTGQVSAEETANTETTATSEYPSYTLNGKTSTVYYEDDFTDAAKYEEALGSYADKENVTPMPIDTEAGVIKTTTNLQYASFNGVDVETNYSVSADITRVTSNKFMAVGAYANENGQGYEFGVIGSSAKPYFRIYNRAEGEILIGSNSSSATDYSRVTKYFSDYDVNKEITLQIDASTDENNIVSLKCYATFDGVKKLIFDCVSSSTQYMTLKSGVPCATSNDTAGYISSISVTSLGVVTDANCLYEDELTSNIGYNAALNNLDTADSKYWSDGKIQVPAGNDCGITFNGIDNASTMENYTVSADVSLNYTSGYAGVMAYGSGTGSSSSGYEFAILNGTRFRLYRRGAESGTSDDEVLINKTADALGLTDWGTTESARLSLTAITNYDETGETVTGVRLIATVYWKNYVKTVYDEVYAEDAKITCGAPGIKSVPNKEATASAVIDNIRVTTVDSQNMPYYEDFEDSSSTVKALWGSDLSVEAENVGTGDSVEYNRYGSLTTKTAYLANASTWTNYAVEVDATMGAIVEGKDPYIGLIVGYVSDVNKGYEFDIWKDYGATTDLYQARLLNKNDTSDSKSVRFDFTPGEVVTLRIELCGMKIKCYVDGEMLFNETVTLPSTQTTTSITGSIGLRSLQCTANFDNVSVHPCEAWEDASPVTLPHVEDFDGDRADMSAQWNHGASVKLEKNEEGNRQAVLATCYGTEGQYMDYDTNINSLYLTGVEDAATWTNYVYEADVTLTDKEILAKEGATAPVDNRIAAIVGAVNSDNAGYEFGLCKNDNYYYVRLYDRINKNPLTDAVSQTQKVTCDFTLNEPVRMKMVILNNTITCYVNGEKYFTYTAEETQTFSGTIGIVTAGNAAKFDNLVVSSAADYYNLEKYRSEADNYTHPYKCGYVFGGWYTDSAYENPLAKAVTTGCAYAKWVAEEVLSVKAQLSADGVDDNGRIMMRLVSTADCDDYIDHGFYVETINSNKEFDGGDLLSSITSRYDDVEVNYTPSGEFHETSTLFSTIILKNLKATNDGTTDHLNKEFTIKPFWVTADGTKVYGVTRVLTIQEGLDAMGKTESVVPFSL